MGAWIPPQEAALLGIMYSTPLEKWTRPVFASAGHNTLRAAWGGYAALR